MLFLFVVLNFYCDDWFNNSMYIFMLDDVSIGYIMMYFFIEDCVIRLIKKFLVFLRN